MIAGRPRSCSRMMLPASLLLAQCIAGALHAQNAPGYTHNDFGEVGLLQTPTARMADEGDLAFTATRTYPYTHYNLSLQPLPWMEAAFRYSAVSNRLYGPIGLSGHQSYKDKSIDLKVRLWDETRWWPAVAVGGRDIAGTGLFSSEYVVASKRFGPVDFTLGMAWGNMGARGDIKSPLGWLYSGFDNRAGNTNQQGGEFNTLRYFRGPAAVIGGIEYQTPLDKLRLKVELDGNNYKHEALANNLRQRSPVNVALLYRVNRNVDVTVGYERGDTVMATLSLHSNLAQHAEPKKTLDPAPEPLREVASTPVPAEGPAALPRKPPGQVDWDELSRALGDNAGIDVSSIGRRGSELVIHGEQRSYFYPSRGVGRMSRVLDNRVDDSIDWFTLSSEAHGMPMVEDSVHRPRFVELLDHRIDMQEMRRSVEQNPPAIQPEEVLYTKPPKKFDAGVALGYQQSLGGPNAFVLYQFSANGSATYRFNRNLWWDGQVNVNLFNNYDKFTYTAPSLLPRVRTNIREYLTTSDVTMPNFQITGTHVLAPDLFGMAYAGMLESMYAGAGGEVLYRPYGERWALGVDMNWVRQRGFRQDFALRGYHTVVGNATLYVNTGFHDVTLAMSVGRYLAKDYGATLDISREFSNGVRMGAYATLTNKSGTQTGEGSFDKGIYFSIPFDLLLPRSSTSRATFMWEPLLRDGGARLNRRYSLYEMTSDRDSDLFEKNLEKIAE
ncbi:YjbH domain-containing protein [Dyella koreensis]